MSHNRPQVSIVARSPFSRCRGPFRGRSIGAVLLLVFAVSAARADGQRAFPEARSGNGELKYINDLPVLIVSGTPEEIGRQKAELTARAIKKLADYPHLLLERANRKDRLPVYLERSKLLVPQLPADHAAELRAAAKHSGIDRELGLLANTMVDIYRGGFACSSLMVEANRSATGGPLFGRNLDFYTLGVLDNYSLLAVHRPKGKHAFISIGFPGLFGCISGMNDAGLAVAVHESFLARDGAAMFNPKGVPYTFCFRRILEECTTVAEAEELLTATERTTILSLAVCDRNGGVVLEMTPRTVAARHSIRGICACTNHFRTDELKVFTWCPRYRKLIQSRTFDHPLDTADVAKKLDEVHMGRMTVQSMIFEPAAMKLHLAVGSCPSSSLPMKTLDLKPLFKP